MRRPNAGTERLGSSMRNLSKPIAESLERAYLLLQKRDGASGATFDYRQSPLLMMALEHLASGSNWSMQVV